MPPSAATSTLYACLRDGDLPGLRRALAAGADPNLPLVREAGEPLLPLVLLVRQSRDPAKGKAWVPLLHVLLDAGARVLPSGPGRTNSGNHPLALAVALHANDAFDLMLQRLTPADRPLLEQPVERYVVAEDTHATPHVDGLLEVAIRHANARAFRVLWDTMGLRPVPSGPCPYALAHGLPPAHRTSALVQVLDVPSSPAQMPVLAHLLAHPWPQDDLDRALRLAVLRARPLPVVQALLDAGADPSAPCADPDDLSHEQMPLLVQALCDPGATPTPGAVAALLRHGADAAVRLDIEPDAYSPSQVSLSPGVAASRPELQDVCLLGLAAHQGHAMAVIELLQAGLDPARALPGTGLTALHLAVQGAYGMPERCAQVVQALLVAGVDPGLPNAQGKTALEVWMERHEPAPDEPLPILAREAAARLVRDTLAADTSVGVPLVDRLRHLMLSRNLEQDDLVNAWGQALEIAARSRRLDLNLPQSAPPVRTAPRM